MSQFQVATSLDRVDEHHFSGQVPDGWQQGRGAFGGVVLGLLTRALVHAEPETSRRLRALNGDICGPVLPGSVDLRVETLRRGNNLTNLDARLMQDSAVQARASAVMSSPRKVELHDIAPSAPPTLTLADATLVSTVGFFPPFTQHYEYWNAGALPFSGAASPTIDGFVRERGRSGALDAVSMIGLLDAFWPALFSIETQPRLIATVTFSAELLVDPATLDGATPLRYRSKVVALREGFFLEHRTLWHAQQLVAMNQQTVAVLR